MPQPAQILIVEDEETDVLLLCHAFEQAALHYDFVVFHDGQEAVDYLTGQEPYANRKEYPLPTLLLLDLKMPG